jgi:hypothetical protein
MITKEDKPEFSRRNLLTSGALGALATVTAESSAAQLLDLNAAARLKTPIDQTAPRLLFQDVLPAEILPGKVLERGRVRYAIPVSWSGDLPSGSHTILYVLSIAVAQTPRKDIFQSTISSAAISFLPPRDQMHLVNAVIGPVAPPVKGVNYQELSGFSPHADLPRHPFLQTRPNFPVDVAMPFEVNEAFYRAVIHRAHELTNSCFYKVSAPYSPTRYVTNCIGALKGVMKYIPSGRAEEKLDTGILYGRDATDSVVKWLLSAARISPHNGVFGSRDDDKVWGLLNTVVANTQPEINLESVRKYRLSL